MTDSDDRFQVQTQFSGRVNNQNVRISTNKSGFYWTMSSFSLSVYLSLSFCVSLSLSFCVCLCIECNCASASKPTHSLNNVKMLFWSTNKTFKIFTSSLLLSAKHKQKYSFNKKIEWMSSFVVTFDYDTCFTICTIFILSSFRCNGK